MSQQDMQLKAWFDAIDVDRSGRLDAKELQRALAMGNLNFGHNDVDQMVRAFDTDNSRTLGFGEFSRLHYFLVNVQNSFQTFDRYATNHQQQQQQHPATWNPPVVLLVGVSLLQSA